MTKIAKLIDHTILKADARREDILQLCKEAKEYSFASVCVNPTWVKLTAEQLAGSEVKVCTVIGFPLGASTSKVKAAETLDAIKNGAQEVDMVLNLGALKDRDYNLVVSDIKAVVQAAADKALVKVILETALLSEAEIHKACQLAVQAGAHYVKTSTGFSRAGAKVSDVKLMRETVGPNIGVKASGGIRTRDDFDKMVAAGASRIGASAGITIIKG